MPMPWSETASTKPVADTAPDTTTGGVGRRERRRVLEQLGEEVRDVGHGAAGDREAVVDADELDAREVGDLGGGGAHDVDERDRLLPLTRLLRTREHEEALRVAAHARRHVVELEQRVEGGGVVLVALEVVEQLELTLHQALVATGEVDEQLAHALAQQPRLLLRDLERHRLDVVERLGEVTDLVLRLHLDADRLDRTDVATGAQRLDQRRQLALRHLAGGGGEAAHRTDHGAGHEPDQQQGEEHGEHRGAAVDAHLAERRAGVRARPSRSMTLCTASIALSIVRALPLVVDVVLGRGLARGGEGRGQRRRGGDGAGDRGVGGESPRAWRCCRTRRGACCCAACAPTHSLKSCGVPLARTAMYTLASRACSCCARSSEYTRVRLAATSALARSRATRSPKSRRCPSTPRKNVRASAADALLTSILARSSGIDVEALVRAVERGQRGRAQPGGGEGLLVGLEELDRGVGAGAGLGELGGGRATAGHEPRRHHALVLQGAAGGVERAQRSRRGRRTAPARATR